MKSFARATVAGAASPTRRSLPNNADVCFMIADQAHVDVLPQLLASPRSFLTEYGDAVFDAGSVSGLGAADGRTFHVKQGRATFNRTDAATDAREVDRWKPFDVPGSLE